MTKEIKATAPTREGLYQEYKRVVKRLELAESCLENGGANRYYEELTLENKTNDRTGG